MPLKKPLTQLKPSSKNFLKENNNINNFEYKDLIEESAEDLYENAPCGYLSYLPDGTIVKINNTLLNWLGYSKVEVLYERKFRDFLSIGGKIFYETHHHPLINMQGFVNELNYDLVKRDKTLLPVLLNSITIKSPEGDPVIYRTTLFNIIDRKKYEVELLKAKKKAELAAKAKAEFLSTISHEIRTPMNAIIGVANLLLEEEHTHQQEEYLKILKTSSDNLLSLVNDILDFSRIESGKISVEEKNFNLKELVNSVAFSLGVKAKERGLELIINLDDQLPEYLKGDPVKIAQVITNLLGNALKFTEKGHVRITAKVLQVVKDTFEVYFEVEDTGIGISKEKLEVIFEEFTQESYDINLAYGGTGLGLTISQKLLELFGSKIQVESQQGVGSKFYFTLSLRRGIKEALPLSPIISEKGKLSDVHLLLAEDNPVNVFIVSQYLNNWGINFDVAENGLRALELVLSRNYDMVLMDIQMPEMNGYVATKKIRERPEEKYKKLPVIALTASARGDIKERMAEGGINDYVCKPFDPKELYKKITYYTNSKKRPRSHFADTDTAEAVFKSTDVIDLTPYIKIAKNDEQKLRTLIDTTIESFGKYKEVFLSSLINRNKEGFDQIEHKSKMIIGMLRAKSLEASIKEAAHLFNENNHPDSEWEEKKLKIQFEIDRVINQLKFK